MSETFYPPSGGYTTPPYSQFPPPFQNPIPALHFPPEMPPRPAQYPPPDQYLQRGIVQRPQQLASVAPRARGEINLPLRQLLLNEQVMVNLQARGWVMGIVLATVKLANAIAGWGYEVRFTPPGKDSVEVDTFPHHSNSIRLP